MNPREKEAPSDKRQWRERSEKPIAARAMSSEEIEEYRHILAQSYECNIDDITTDFERIRDENDEDRDDCLWLKYKMKHIKGGKQTTRVIFTIKLPIPEEIRQMAEQMRQQKNQRARAGRRGGAGAGAGGGTGAIVATTMISDIETLGSSIIIEEPEDITSAAPTSRPKLKRPARKRV